MLIEVLMSEFHSCIMQMRELYKDSTFRLGRTSPEIWYTYCFNLVCYLALQILSLSIPEYIYRE